MVIQCHDIIRALIPLNPSTVRTVDSRYLKIEGTLKNTLRYPYLDISDM